MQTLKTLKLDENHISPRGLKELALGLQVNSTIVELPLPMSDIAQCLKSDFALTKEAVHDIQARLGANTNPLPSMQLASDQPSLTIVSSTAQRSLENALIQLDSTQPYEGEDPVATLLLRESARRAIHLCAGVAASQAEFKHAFLTSLEQQLFKVSQDMSQAICDKLRANSGRLLDQLVGSEGRAAAANNIRPFISEHEVNVRKYVGKSIADAAGLHVSGLVAESMNQLSIEVISSLTDQYLVRLLQVIRLRKLQHKSHELVSQPSSENIGILLSKSEANLAAVASTTSVPEPENTPVAPAPEDLNASWRASRLPFTAENTEDVVKKEAPIDLSQRSSQFILKASKPLVHLTKDRPRGQVWHMIV